jgi:hypothetical protein
MPELGPTGRANDLEAIPSSPVDNSTSAAESPSPTPSPSPSGTSAETLRSERAGKTINKSKMDDDMKKSLKRCNDVTADVAKRRGTDACKKRTSTNGDQRKGWTFDSRLKKCKSLPYLEAGCADTTNKFIDKDECTKCKINKFLFKN